MTITAYGVDLSSYQAVLDARAAYSNRIRFAYVKATEGTTFADPTMHAHADALMAAGIKVGVYHFARPGDPVAQAQWFKQVGGQYMQPGNLRPALDIEANGPTLDSWHNAFHDTLAMPSVVYGSLSWFTSLAINPNGWGTRDVLSWVAAYNGTPGVLSTVPPRTAMHQHTSSGTVPGLSSPDDRDVIFNGYTLANLTLGTPAPPQEIDMQPSDLIGDSGPGHWDHEWLNTNQQINNAIYGLPALNTQLDAMQTQLSAIQGALSKEETDLLAALKTVQIAAVDPKALSAALVSAGLPQAVAAAFAVLVGKAAV